MIETSYDPYSVDAMNLAHRITTTAENARPNTSLAQATVSVAGFPAVNSDIQRFLWADFAQLALATTVIVGIIFGPAARSTGTDLPSGHRLTQLPRLHRIRRPGLQWILGHEIAWPVPLLAFIILVAVGADYNMLLVSRLREESGSNIRVGVLRTVANTGAVITSAGLIFAVSMFGLMVGSVAIMVRRPHHRLRTCSTPSSCAPSPCPPSPRLLREASWWPHLVSRNDNPPPSGSDWRTAVACACTYPRLVSKETRQPRVERVGSHRSRSRCLISCLTRRVSDLDCRWG